MPRRIACSMAVVVIFVLLAGCAGRLGSMQPVPPSQPFGEPTPGKATIVFLRPSTLGYAIQSSVFELSPRGDEFVAIVPAKKKVAHVTAPGRTRFMVISEAADFLEAELEAGKVYYALVTPRMGVWKARFSLRPVTIAEMAEPKFSEWLKDCEPIENTEQSRSWATSHWASIQSKKTEYLQKWNARQDVPTLRASDGR